MTHERPLARSLVSAVATDLAAGVGKRGVGGSCWFLRCLTGEPTHSLTSSPYSSASARPRREDADSSGLICLICSWRVGETFGFLSVGNPLLSSRSIGVGGVGTPDWLVLVLCCVSLVDKDSIAALTPLLPSSPALRVSPVDSTSIFAPPLGSRSSMSARPNSQP